LWPAGWAGVNPKDRGQECAGFSNCSPKGDIGKGDKASLAGRVWPSVPSKLIVR